jgi:hypothetical protein
MLHSKKLSKSKPLGILRFALFRSILIADARSLHQQQEEQPTFARLTEKAAYFS